VRATADGDGETSAADDPRAARRTHHQLGPAERALVELAAIAGTEFDTTALIELAPPAAVDLAGATRLARAQEPSDQRAAACDAALPLQARADPRRRLPAHQQGRRLELHERFAAWLEARQADDEFCDELVGHHLEQAYRCRVDLGMRDAATAAIAANAADRLREPRGAFHAAISRRPAACSSGRPRSYPRNRVGRGSSQTRPPRSSSAATSRAPRASSTVP
jgi:hypothetical protein